MSPESNGPRPPGSRLALSEDWEAYMRRVALVACCLAGGTIVGCLAGGSVLVEAKERPREVASLAKSMRPLNIVPASSTAPAAKRAKPPAAAPVIAKKHSCADVIGTSRTIVAGANVPQQIGLMQYKTSLPLKDHEVVLTFDDGPVHPYTARVLDILAANCVKATFFVVGQQATAYPRLVRRIYNEGHSIGTHSEHHPLGFGRLPEPAIAREVDEGIASVQAAVGDPRAVAPFFRVPGLRHSKRVDSYLAAHALMEWSADEDADDWRHGITPHQIVQRAMKRIAARGHRGVLLLHDIHPATAKALPMLFAELRAHGYHIVHIVPSGERPKSVPPLPATMIAHAPRHKAVHHRHAAHSQSLSALAHKKHPTRTVERGAATPPSNW
jgi:peptidoglycan/xylan/chitin deacetylase (PgdA/CDA1 family)